MPASLATLPTELLRLIIELAVPPESLDFTAAKARREGLLALTRVDKRLHELAQPLLRKTILLESSSQGQRLMRQGVRYAANTLVISLDAEYGSWDSRDLPAWAGVVDYLRLLPLVKAVSITRGADRPTVDVQSTPLTGVEQLLITDCHIWGHLPPTQVCSTLVSLALDQITLQPLDHPFTPEAFPALHFLRLSANEGHYQTEVFSAEFYDQLVAHQLRTPGGPSISNRFRDVTEIRNKYAMLLDRTLIEWPHDSKHPQQQPQARHLYFPGTEPALSGPALGSIVSEFSSLEALFVPRT